MAEKMECWPGWETVREIGKGSYGAVYEVQRELAGTTEKAAVKVLHIPGNGASVKELLAEGEDNASITKRFEGYRDDALREYLLMSRMKGQTNVVCCDDVRYIQQEDGFGWDIYIKMELLTPLSDVLTGAISEDLVIRMSKDLCSALTLCGKHNIVHRDIKPQNIFISSTGDFKLGDFGIAKTIEKTSLGTKIGTFNYMAPEVFHNQSYGASADICSLGLVMYWLLNERRHPFLPLPPAVLTNSLREEARQRWFSGEPLPAPAHGSKELKDIVLKACAFDPTARYTDPQQMRDALAALAGGSDLILYDRKADLPPSLKLRPPEEL